MGQEVGGDHGAPGGDGELHEQQPDRAAPDDADRRAGPHVAEVVRVQRDAERLQHGAVDRGQRRRQRMQQVGRPGHQLAQAAVHVAVPREPDVRAQVAVAVPAEGARLARDRRVDRHRGPVLGDAGELVAEHERAVEPGVADARLAVPVQIGSAQPHGGHPHQAVPGRHVRRRLVGDPQVADAVQADGPHRSRSTQTAPWSDAAWRAAVISG